MGLKRHAIARALISEFGGDFDADRLELPHRIGELSERFSVTYSTMHRHLGGLQEDGILLARQPLVLSPTVLNNVEPNPPPSAARPPLRLIKTAAQGAETAHSPQNSPATEALWQLAAQALHNRDHIALATIVDGLVSIATDTAPPVVHTAQDQPSRFRDEFRDASRNRDAGRREPSRNHESEMKTSVHSGSFARETSRNRDAGRREASRDLDPPKYGITPVDDAVHTAWGQLTLNPGADATPAWLRLDHDHSPDAWTGTDIEVLRQHWRAKTGTGLSAQLTAILRLWTPPQATAAINAVCDDPKITNKGGRLRNAAVLGYHQYFPTEPVDPLPYWETWIRDLHTPASDLPELQANLEALAAITGSDVYPIRVAAAVSPFVDDLDTIAQWGCVAIDKDLIESTLNAYQTTAPRSHT